MKFQAKLKDKLSVKLIKLPVKLNDELTVELKRKLSVELIKLPVKLMMSSW